MIFAVVSVSERKGFEIARRCLMCDVLDRSDSNTGKYYRSPWFDSRRRLVSS
jgi:hypothetical protein